jgi:2,4-dienoyl-CoA reductase (NADPH2)
VGRSPVKVELGHEVSADDVVDLKPDAVVVANGGQVVLPSIPGSDLPHVQTGRALRERFGGWRQRLVRPTAIRAASKAWMPLGHRVVIVGADLVALELAEFLAARGRLVSVLEADKTIAPELGNKRKTEHMDRLDRLGVAVHVSARRQDRARWRRLHAVRWHQPPARRGQRRHRRHLATEHRTVRKARRRPAQRCGARRG